MATASKKKPTAKKLPPITNQTRKLATKSKAKPKASVKVAAAAKKTAKPASKGKR